MGLRDELAEALALLDTELRKSADLERELDAELSKSADLERVWRMTGSELHRSELAAKEAKTSEAEMSAQLATERTRMKEHLEIASEGIYAAQQRTQLLERQLAEARAEAAPRGYDAMAQQLAITEKAIFDAQRYAKHLESQVAHGRTADQDIGATTCWR